MMSSSSSSTMVASSILSRITARTALDAECIVMRSPSHSIILLVFRASTSLAVLVRNSVIEARCWVSRLHVNGRVFNNSSKASLLASTGSSRNSGISSTCSHAGGGSRGFVSQDQTFDGVSAGGNIFGCSPGGFQDHPFSTLPVPPAPKSAPNSPAGGPMLAGVTAHPILLFDALLRASNGPGTLLP